jgi:hypothetical protein
MDYITISNIADCTDTIASASSDSYTRNEDDRKWGRLPEELIVKILHYLSDIDSCGYLFMVSKTYFFVATEEIFKHLCEKVYLNQTNRKILRLERWRSWRRMLICRPRLRTNGFYFLSTLYAKPPNNDAFWEEKKVKTIEVLVITDI